MKTTAKWMTRRLAEVLAIVLCAVLTASIPSDADKGPRPPRDLVKRCDKDEPEAMRLLGQFWWAHAAEDPAALKKAVFWIERAATVDDHAAQLMASEFYEKGIGVAQNPTRAAWFAMHAARSGNAKAQERYAHFLQTGFGVDADPEEARLWYAKAAAQGQQEASKALAELKARQSAAVATGG